MTEHHTLTPATKKDLETAKAKGQLIGFAQGAGAMILVGIALKFLGWIPIVLVGGAVAYVGYKLLFGRKDKGED